MKWLEYIYNSYTIRIIGIETSQLNMKAFIAVLLVTAVAAEKDYDTECPPEQAGDWSIEKLLRHEDCEKFYSCALGKPVEMSCPERLWFNLKTWQCDYPQNVDCSGRNEPTLPPPDTTTAATTTTTTPEPTTTTTTTTTTTPAPTTTTTTPAPTTTTPAPTTTTTTTTTPAPTTTTTTTTTPAPTTTSTPKTPETTNDPEFSKNGCPVNPYIHWLLPHETDCNLFYYCVWGEKVLRQCPSSLHFNKVKQVCDFSNRAGCSNSFDKNALKRRELILGY